MSHLSASYKTMSIDTVSEQNRQRLVAIDEQIAGFERNLANADQDTCVPALQENIAFLRAERAALLTGIQANLVSAH